MSEKSPSEQAALSKVVIFSMSLPVAIYAFLTSLNDVFGIDLTGTWMGERDPVGAGYTVLFGFPIYVYYLFKALLEFVRR